MHHYSSLHASTKGIHHRPCDTCSSPPGVHGEFTDSDMSEKEQICSLRIINPSAPWAECSLATGGSGAGPTAKIWWLKWGEESITLSLRSSGGFDQISRSSSLAVFIFLGRRWVLVFSQWLILRFSVPEANRKMITNDRDVFSACSVSVCHSDTCGTPLPLCQVQSVKVGFFLTSKVIKV